MCPSGTKEEEKTRRFTGRRARRSTGCNILFIYLRERSKILIRFSVAISRSGSAPKKSFSRECGVGGRGNQRRASN